MNEADHLPYPGLVGYGKVAKEKENTAQAMHHAQYTMSTRNVHTVCVKF